MALRIAFMSASIATVFAHTTEIFAERDALLSLLQAVVEVQKRNADGVADLEIEDENEYQLAEPLNCAREEVAPVEPAASLAEPAAVAPEEPVVDAPQEPEKTEADPPETVAVRMALQIGIVLLICDGLRKWRLQKQSVDQKGSQCQQAQEGQSEAAATLAWSKMVNAAQSGDERSFKEALTQHPAVTKSDAWGCTPLHFAAVGGSTAIASELLKLGADINAFDAVDETALHIAARTGGVSFCELLLSAGASIDAVNKDGMTPLVVAGLANQEPTCHFLADNGAGAAGLFDKDLPPLVVSQVVRKMFTPSLTVVS